MSDSAQAVDEDIVEIRKTCPVFRVLIIGKANAGKTTILQKVCNVDKDTKPIVYDAAGRELKDWDVPVSVAEEGNSARTKRGSRLSKIKSRVQHSSLMRSVAKRLTHPTGGKSRDNSESDSEVSDTGDILRPSTQRGLHDINNQITYPGSHFIFHDSRGIEAGSVDELQIIHKFIHERASKQSLAERLHAIWFCVPMDDRRPLVDAELSFLNESTESVPVVVVFTKYDALLNRAANKLKIIELTEDNKHAINKEAEAIYQVHYKDRVMKAAHGPKAVVRLQELHKAETHCPELSEQTAAAIDNLSLCQLFISVQQNNIKLCMHEAARTSRQQGLEESMMIARIWAVFPHAWEKPQGLFKPEEWVDDAERIRREELLTFGGGTTLSTYYEFGTTHTGWTTYTLFDIEVLINVHKNAAKKHSMREQLAAAAIMIGADSFPMPKGEGYPWTWSLERYIRTSQVQDYIQDMVAKQFTIFATKETQAQVLLNIANLALEYLKAECDKADAHEEEAHH